MNTARKIKDMPSPNPHVTGALYELKYPLKYASSLNKLLEINESSYTDYLLIVTVDDPVKRVQFTGAWPSKAEGGIQLRNLVPLERVDKPNAPSELLAKMGLRDISSEAQQVDPIELAVKALDKQIKFVQETGLPKAIQYNGQTMAITPELARIVSLEHLNDLRMQRTELKRNPVK